MSPSTSDVTRITAEYARRAREIPEGFYSLAKPANLLMHEQTLRNCLALLDKASMFPLDPFRIADIGCGWGTRLLQFVEWGADPANVAGIDLLPERIQLARHRLPQADIHLGSASKLPWPDESFDLVSQFLVFTNMFDRNLTRDVAGEMLRVLKPGGAILWFDLRIDNPRNREVRGIRAAEIRSLFPNCQVRLTPTLLAVPISRKIAGWAWPLASLLGEIPFLCTHYTGLIRKK